MDRLCVSFISWYLHDHWYLAEMIQLFWVHIIHFMASWMNTCRELGYQHNLTCGISLFVLVRVGKDVYFHLIFAKNETFAVAGDQKEGKAIGWSFHWSIFPFVQQAQITRRVCQSGKFCHRRNFTHSLYLLKFKDQPWWDSQEIKILKQWCGRDYFHEFCVVFSLK